MVNTMKEQKIDPSVASKIYNSYNSIFDNILNQSPKMSRDEKTWQSSYNCSQYGTDSYDYAEKIARIAQYLMITENARIAEVFLKASHFASPTAPEEILSEAIAILTEHWLYGSILKTWIEDTYGTFLIEEDSIADVA